MQTNRRHQCQHHTLHRYQSGCSGWSPCAASLSLSMMLVPFARLQHYLHHQISSVAPVKIPNSDKDIPQRGQKLLPKGQSKLAPPCFLLHGHFLPGCAACRAGPFGAAAPHSSRLEAQRRHQLASHSKGMEHNSKTKCLGFAWALLNSLAFAPTIRTAPFRK